MPAPLLQIGYPSVAEFITAFNAEISKGGLLIRGATLIGAQSGSEVQLEVIVTGRPSVQVPARVAAVVPGVGVAVMFEGMPPALTQLAEPAEEAEPPEEEAPKGSLSERLKAMSVPEKMQLALAGSRDERAGLFRDTNKMLHVFVLKNPRIGLDEVQAAAKMPQLSPEALKMIAEHREWSGNPIVASALVRNPKTPLPLALKLLDRVPMTDLRAIAKGGAREQVVHAARKKVVG
jgi:hypothetical protein